MVLLQTKILPFGNPHHVIAVDGYNDWLVTVYNMLCHSQEKAGVTEEMWPWAELQAISVFVDTVHLSDAGARWTA